MDKVQKWAAECAAKEMVEILKEQSYAVQYADNLEEARKLVLDLVPEGSSVAVGGSVTLEQMDLVETFRSGNYSFFERYKQPSWPETVEVYRQSLLADVFVTSANAVTKNGESVCLDCTGNRAASMIFGPKKVVIILGANKIVENLEAGIARAKEIAPLNCKRVGHKTPCAETDVCTNCEIPQRMCNAIGVVTTGIKFEGRINVIMVGDEAGY